MVCITGRYLYACQENYDEFLKTVLGKLLIVYHFGYSLVNCCFLK